MSKVLDKLSSANPANARETTTREAGRIPMSVPQTKLGVPDLPGYHTHWMMGTPQRIQQALRAGYQFVKDDELFAGQQNVAGDPMGQGSTDMGTNVTLPSGSDQLDSQGNSVPLVLMKLPLEYWEEDQRKIAERNEQVAKALRGEGEDLKDLEQRAYIPERQQAAMANMFTRKRSL